MIKDKYIRKQIKKSIIASILILIMSIVAFLMYKYSVEGETDMPFYISKMMVISCAQNDNFSLQNDTYVADVIQKNDFYFFIEKNNNQDEMIKNITINNFNIKQKSEIGTIKFYRPSMAKNKPYEYIEEYEVTDLVYMGGLKDNIKLETPIISNQGGTIEFSIGILDLGKIIYNENENIEITGKVLNKLNIKEEQIKFEVCFDMIIEVESGNKFKTTINMILPFENILEKGISTQEITDSNKFVFKRVY